MNKPLLSVHEISKSFHTRELSLKALEKVCFTVDQGEFVTIIGPSGSGKSTLFNILAGLLEPDEGSIQCRDGEPAGCKMGYMPQRDLLLPWRRVIDNATLPLEAAGVSRKAAREQVGEHLESFGLTEFSRSYPGELSGGMRQRAALLRTVSTGRQTLLLDEPFGALDAITRRQMQDWLLDLHRELHRTVLFITHDVDEAVYLADRVIVLGPRPGRVIGELTVPLPRPRGQHMTAQAGFSSSVATLLADLGLSHPEPAVTP
jgi:putative hydroxymethylpyrimidine transport system ATP-binding protein